MSSKRYPEEFKIEAAQETSEYIEVVYNRQWKQKKPGQLSPQHLRGDTMQHCALPNPSDSTIDSTAHFGCNCEISSPPLIWWRGLPLIGSE